MNKKEIKQQILIIVVPITIFAFLIGSYVGQNSAIRKNVLADSNITDTSLVDSQQFEAFWKVWNVLDKKYVESASTTSE